MKLALAIGAFAVAAFFAWRALGGERATGVLPKGGLGDLIGRVRGVPEPVIRRVRLDPRIYGRFFSPIDPEP